MYTVFDEMAMEVILTTDNLKKARDTAYNHQCVLKQGDKVLHDYRAEKNIRYMVTCIRKLGLRQIIDSQQGRNSYATVEEAREDLANVLKNSVETLVNVYGPQCMGTFRVSPIECWPNRDGEIGDPKGIYTDEVIE